MGDFNFLMTRSGTFTDEELVILGGAVMMVGLVYLLSFVFMIIMFFVNAVPYFIMGRKAGFKHAWLAFIPFGQNYVAMTLPHREFNIFNKFKTTNRKKAFWAYVITWGIWLVTLIINEITSWISSYLEMIDIENVSVEAMGGMLIGMLVLLAVQLVVLVVTLVNTFAMIMIRWRTYYDVLNTYREPQHAMWVSIVSLFFPIVMTVFTYIIMNKKPEYGFGNYYETEIISNKSQNGLGNSHETTAQNHISATAGNELTNEETEDVDAQPGPAVAIVAFVCGIISLVSLGCAGPAIWVAIICGIIGKKKYLAYTSEYKKSHGGMVMAIIALIVGFIIGTLIWGGPIIYFLGSL